MTDESELLARIEAFLSASGMTPTAFGRGAINDRNLVKQLRENKRELRRRTRADIEAFLLDPTKIRKPRKRHKPRLKNKSSTASIPQQGAA